MQVTASLFQEFDTICSLEILKVCSLYISYSFLCGWTESEENGMKISLDVSKKDIITLYTGNQKISTPYSLYNANALLFLKCWYEGWQWTDLEVGVLTGAWDGSDDDGCGGYHHVLGTVQVLGSAVKRLEDGREGLQQLSWRDLLDCTEKEMLYLSPGEK